MSFRIDPFSIKKLNKMNIKLSSLFLLMGIFLIASCTKENIDQTTIDDTNTVDPTVVLCDLEVQIQNDSGLLAPIIIGGIAPFIIEWPDKIDSTFTPDSLFAPKINGDYSVIVTDAQGCTISETINVMNADPCLGFGIFQVIDFEPIKKMTVDAFRGTPPYSYLWSTGDTTNFLARDTGSYQVTATDSNGCTVIGDFNAGSGTDPCASIWLTIVELPPGSGTLISSVGGSGGVPPYSYEWSTGETTDNISVVNEGIYSLTVTDDNGCMVETSLNYVNTCIDLVSNSYYDNVNNLLGTNPSGGTPPYRIEWSTGETTQEISVTSGMYTLDIFDATGCTFSESFDIP